ncbi:MAG: hypothetical protein NT120_00145 [Candidatus Aenigmarchaeota archaeon]|nr:hypothetical protein [Candidatus Aenigmarchaeota archaeon]
MVVGDIYPGEGKQEKKSVLKKIGWKRPLSLVLALGATYALNEGIKDYAINANPEEQGPIGYYAEKLIKAIKTPNLFDNVKWKRVEYLPTNAGLWPFYMAENVDHNQSLWLQYQIEVDKRNRFNSRGETKDNKILLPDLDGNGKVEPEAVKK